MDITLKVSLQPPADLSATDTEAARHWLAGEIRNLTGVPVENYDASGKAFAEYEVTSVAFIVD
jgi:hypothetical protein